MARLDGKVAVITGGGAGIGRACAALFVNEGAKVAILELDPVTGQESMDGANTNSHEAAQFFETDATDEASLTKSFKAAAEAFGKIDILVNCAGGSIGEDKAVTDVDMDVWDHTINLDLKGPFLTCRVGIPYLIEAGGGSVVNFTSIVALKGSFPGHVYTAAKGGIISLTQALAGRYWRNGIRVNAIAPGIILSERVGNRLGIDLSQSTTQQIAEAHSRPSRMVDKHHPFGFGVPEDIATVALFLASDESRMVNAAVIPAEGGAAHY